MKKQIILFFTLVIIFFCPANTRAQDKAMTRVATVKQNGETIDFTLSSSHPFIFGNNRYILYIGNKEFTLNRQTEDGGKGYITFFVPADDFSRLQEGSGIYLSYGQVDLEQTNMDELAKNTRRCWSLGNFSKGLLTK